MATVGSGFDDPTSRTRMAWSRTILVGSVLTALLLRGVFVLDRSWELAVVLILLSGSMIVLSLARMRRLAKYGVAAGARPARRTYAWILFGVLGMATIGVVFAFV